ncbi:hypothetical protein JNUCC0626_04890 [Lentzea sp. JNUCC 0626]|uniref:hypothetical protein n=1 Tax=Lentzea sp. JNUCC 0626 TaxID=3367513 RepID=UPI00374A8236
MNRRNVTAGVLSALVLGSAVVTPQAAAAACQYVRQDLPLPAGGSYPHTTGSSTNNSRVVGAYWQNGSRGAVWTNSVLRVMAAPANSADQVEPAAVNNTGVVAGVHQTYRGANPPLYKAFRYENNTYTFLAVEAGEQSRAVAINDAGDVLGMVWQEATPNVRTVVMWPRNGLRKDFGPGLAIGIDAQRRIVKVEDPASTAITGWVVNGDTGARLKLEGARTPMVFDNDRVLHYESTATGTQIVELDLTGARVATYEGGVNVYGRNGSGTVFGTFGITQPSLWRKTGRSEVVADKLPDPTYYADVTDAATLIGTYRDADDSSHPARWVWTCA